MICCLELASGENDTIKRGDFKGIKEGLLSRNAISRVWTDTYWDRIAFYKWVIYLRDLPPSIPEIKGWSTILALYSEELLDRICLRFNEWKAKIEVLNMLNLICF
ncbi:unnamed protein product [marine sediment metagenome]|uniref:Uncharacterized protein n=1 Tax=marine sediment metagenome TaxID=412755 RepID=X0YN56_9ZZZZ